MGQFPKEGKRDIGEISKVCFGKTWVSVEFVAIVSLWNVFKNTGP